MPDTAAGVERERVEFHRYGEYIIADVREKLENYKSSLTLDSFITENYHFSVRCNAISF